MKITHILFEGKVDDFKKVFKDKFTTPEQIDAIIKVSEEIDPKHKFLIWLGKTLTKPIFNNEISFGEELSNAQELLLKFKNIGANLPIKDITQYKDLNELSNAIKTYENKQRRTIKKVDDADIVYEDDELTVVHPLSYKSSCYYGKGSKWCTASESDSSHWYSYNEESKLFYFLSKKLPTNDRFYKVALLRGYNGSKQFWDAPDKQFSSGWLIGTKYLDNILNVIDQYMLDNYKEKINIYTDKEKAEKERERLRIIRANEIRNNKLREANQRREDDEWNPDNIFHGDVGSKAWALFTYLLTNTSLEEKKPNDDERLEVIETKLDELNDLQTQYEIEGRDLTDIDGEISALEEEKEELENRIDVYSLIPEGNNYELTVFSVLHPDYAGYEYTVGDDDQIDRSANEYLQNYVNEFRDIREAFGKRLLLNHIDGELVASEARSNYEDWVRDSPESYLDSKDRLLSNSQEKEINEYKVLIAKYERFRQKAIERQNEMDPYSSKWKAIEIGIDKLTDLISDLEYDIESIEEEPEGDWDEDKIEEAIDSIVNDVEDDPLSWLKEMGIEDISNYINIDSLIEDVINTDGYYRQLNGYDGDGDTIVWDGEIYHIMNTDR